MRQFVCLGAFLLIALAQEARADCTNPDAPEKKIVYNDTAKVYDGTNWRTMLGGGGLPTCPAGDQLVSAASGWQCSSGGGPPDCVFVGDVCDDGSVYAGLSPDGYVPMYTTPADEGLYHHKSGQ